jgi:DNA invertase Pin-like site-specific DNA recombinase
MLSDLYARKSTSDQGRSVARQERMWRADCVSEGVTPGRVFADPDLSASRHGRRPRPDFAALVEHIRASRSEMVSMWEVTRGSRQVGEWVSFLDLCRDQGVLIRVFGSEDPQTFDPRRQRDRETLINEGIKAEGEVERLRSRVLPGIADAAAQGRPPGPLLFGYRRIYGAPTEDSVSPSGNRRPEIIQVLHEEHAALVRKLAKDTLAGIPLQTQANRLNDTGVSTPAGRGKWSGAQINRMLRNPGYEGHRVHQGQIVAACAWPAILDAETAAALRALLETPGRRSHANSALTYQLSGAARCGVCRKHLRVRPDRNGLRRYECRNKGCFKVAAHVAQMDPAVDAIVVARLRRPDAAGAFTSGVDTAALEAARAELRTLTDRRDELYAAAAKPGGPSMALVAAAERELLPQIDAAEAKVRTLQTPPLLHGYNPEDLAERWSEYTVGERRAVVMALADVVLTPVGSRGRWSLWRLAESRWHGDDQTWGDVWRATGDLPES